MRQVRVHLNPPAPAEDRRARHRRRIVEGGGKVLYILLYPEAAAALKRICEHYDCPRSSAVETSLLAYASRIKLE